MATNMHINIFLSMYECTQKDLANKIKKAIITKTTTTVITRIITKATHKNFETE